MRKMSSKLIAHTSTDGRTDGRSPRHGHTDLRPTRRSPVLHPSRKSTGNWKSREHLLTYVRFPLHAFIDDPKYREDWFSLDTEMPMYMLSAALTR